MMTGRKTEQAIKISASWTPNEETAKAMRKVVFGKNSPLHIRGGQLTLNAAIAIDMTDPAQAGRVAERVLELKKELLATGTLHRFSTQAGSVAAGTAEKLPAPVDLSGTADPEEDRINGEADERAQGAS
jgi:hypothetical protein